jgi:hypothetical protein
VHLRSVFVEVLSIWRCGRTLACKQGAKGSHLSNHFLLLDVSFLQLTMPLRGVKVDQVLLLAISLLVVQLANAGPAKRQDESCRRTQVAIL